MSAELPDREEELRRLQEESARLDEELEKERTRGEALRRESKLLDLETEFLDKLKQDKPKNVTISEYVVMQGGIDEIERIYGLRARQVAEHLIITEIEAINKEEAKDE